MKLKTKFCVYRYKSGNFYYVIAKVRYERHLQHYQDLKLVKMFVGYNEARKLAGALNTL